MDSVRFHGLLAHDKYCALLERADVGLQPSRTAADGDTEGGAPTVLLEMQAAGKPVIATRHVDIPSVVADEDALADENDVDDIAAAMVWMASMGTREWQDACATRRVAESRHDARITAAAVEDIYDLVAGADRESRA